MSVFTLIFEYSSRTSQNDVTHVWNHSEFDEFTVPHDFVEAPKYIAFAKSTAKYRSSARLTVNPNMRVISSLEVAA